MFTFLDQGRDERQCVFGIAQHLYGGFHVLVHLCQVDVEMNDFCLTGIGVEVAGDTVVETHADGDQHVALVGIHVGSDITVHPQHPCVERVVGGDGGKPEDGRAERNAAFLQESQQLLLRISEDHALSY